MQGARVPVADGFFPSRLSIDGIQGERRFDEFLPAVHGISAFLSIVGNKQNAVGTCHALGKAAIGGYKPPVEDHSDG